MWVCVEMELRTLYMLAEYCTIQLHPLSFLRLLFFCGGGWGSGVEADFLCVVLAILELALYTRLA